MLNSMKHPRKRRMSFARFSSKKLPKKNKSAMEELLKCPKAT
jgi:hypothetical protein